MPTAGGVDTASPDTIKAMPPDMLFDYLGVRLNGPKAAGKVIELNVDLTDLEARPIHSSSRTACCNYSDKASGRSAMPISL